MNDLYEKSSQEDIPYWETNLSKYSSGIIKLHYEIFDYSRHKILPSMNYKERRNITIKKFENILFSYYPTSTYIIYGSSIQNLDTKDSDIDISIIFNLQYLELSEISFLFNFKEILISEGFSTNENTEIINAKVPIIKTICNETNFHIDISLNQTDGLEFAKIINKFICHHPILKYMILFIKKFLSSKKLNNGNNGGMSSYSIIILVIHFYQIYISNNENKINLNFGNLFIMFLNYYVNEFDYQNNGISIKEGGKVFKIISKFKWNYEINNDNKKISIESYIDEDCDIGRHIDKFNDIYNLFQKTLLIIRNLLEKNDKKISFLNEIGLE